ncbi:PhzF family phenazine biosynthesis isomerase [Micromonospora sp. IBHARD004]|uniref:PhzF family phenazine biosynthesis isomerase n=1 Tax=Micromonospora sp. IBHARD004 TaxID=3457764 RepID=UPI0040588032
MTDTDDATTARPEVADVEVLRYAAFPDGAAGGNPAGVVLEAASLDDATRLAVAASVGYSETAFLEPSRRDGEFRVRYFSPLAEVAFCGHATIAAAVALAERRGSGPLLFQTLAGAVEVSTAESDAGLTATLTSVPTRTRPASGEELTAALAALRWRSTDLDPRYPVHVANAGNDHLVLAVSNRTRLADLHYDYGMLAALMAERGWTTLQLVHAHTPLLFSARNPFPPGGVVEDPATGAAAAALGGYLRALHLVDPPAQITLLQGTDMGSPSRLLVDVTRDDDRVQVTGSARSIR